MAAPWLLRRDPDRPGHHARPGLRGPAVHRPGLPVGGPGAVDAAAARFLVAQPGLAGSTPARGGAYAAVSRRVAVIGIGSTVYAYRPGSGEPLWVSSLAGFRAGS